MTMYALARDRYETHNKPKSYAEITVRVMREFTVIIIAYSSHRAVFNLLFSSTESTLWNNDIEFESSIFRNKIINSLSFKIHYYF